MNHQAQNEQSSRRADTDSTSHMGGIDDPAVLLGQLKELARYGTEMNVSATLIQEALGHIRELQKVVTNPDIPDKLLNSATRSHQRLSRVLAPACLISLRATDGEISVAYRHQQKMQFRAVVILSVCIGTLVVINTVNSIGWIPRTLDKNLFTIPNVIYLINTLFKAILPGFFGLLGAYFFLLRATEKKTHSREFCPSMVAEHRTRAIMGWIAGATFGFLIRPENNVVQGIAQEGLAFIVGYATDIFVHLLDRVIKSIKTGSPMDQEEVHKATKNRLRKKLEQRDLLKEDEIDALFEE